jgi:hypothetical protein
MPPLVAVIVKVDVPVGDLRLVLMVRVDDPEVVMEAGLKLALVRRGRPETEKVTTPVKPAPGVTVIP